MSKTYNDAIIQKRRMEDERVSKDALHWINLAGLFWLEEGDNFFGNAETNAIVHASFPMPVCGNFKLQNGLVHFLPVDGLQFSSNNLTDNQRPLLTDQETNPDLIHVNSLAMKVIVRGNDLLIRMWDRESPVKKEFAGFKHYPVDKGYCIPAKYVRYDTPKIVKRIDMIGNESEGTFLGQVQFEFKGKNYSLETEKSGDNLMVHFTDETNADTTYGAGRRIYFPPPESSNFILDFNLTTNWPCAYTPFATCPVAPPENRIHAWVEAGEKRYFEK